MTTDYTTLGSALVARHVGALQQAARSLKNAPTQVVVDKLRGVVLGVVLEEQARLGQAVDVARAEAIAAEAVTSGERGLRCDFNLVAARLLGVDVVSPSIDGS